ncbi:MAG TPA: 3',5'-cyclic-nucleotide phosphodiesterase [Planctomycetaceae bacterium]|nr:3',5'-cyclic-nucleotide phosphodiesterase [Planctomycetaceae bacterium]
MLTVLHISDLHFGPPYREQIGEKLLELTPQLRPDVIVISGDFTQRAKDEQFREASEFIKRLPDVPQVVVPGNHDVPLYRVAERFRNPHGLYQQHIHPELNHVVTVDGAMFVALDSTAPRTAITNGRIRQDQLEFCCDWFAGAEAGAARIVVAHHPFASAPDYAHDARMPRLKSVLQRFTELGVDMILGGHLHRAYIGNSLDVIETDHDRSILIVQSGTSTSRRGRARETNKNSFNLITIDSDHIDVEHHIYLDDTERFEPASQHRFPRFGKRLPNSQRQ